MLTYVWEVKCFLLIFYWYYSMSVTATANMFFGMIISIEYSVLSRLAIVKHRFIVYRYR